MVSTAQTPLAIIGMACRVPGADDLDQFWELLIGGKCALGEAPADRLNRELHYDPRRGVRSKTYMSIGGTIQYPPFDSLHCPIPARRLASAEVGHQTICQVAAAACRHAGLNPFDLPERNVGVYVGHNLGGPVAGELIYATRVAETARYLLEVSPFLDAVKGEAESIVERVVDRIRRNLPRRGAGGIPRSSINIGAAIISEALGLNGPSLVLDAACSSALQGLAMASRALRLNRIDMAIVGGASYFSTDSLILFSKAQSGSSRGSCPFDDAADGLVSGEGYAAILVKTLDRALAEGDPIHAVIRGIGVSSDGRGKSLWAPRQEGQVLAMERAYRGGLDLRRLQFVEAHATSTRLGDLTEMKALAELLDGHLPSGHKIPIGGVKANVGHTLESAGLVGLIKTVLAMQNKTVPQQINVSKLNTGVDWDHAPFYVPTSNVVWPEFEDGHPRRAAVNSFGIGGLNVHVVVDEQVTEMDQPKDARVAVTALSPPTARQPVAIVGAGCIFPGARTLKAFCQQLSSGHDPKTDVPADRWDVKLGHIPDVAQPYHSVVKRGGFITDFEFDWRRHKIPPLHVAHADPLQLMVLDATDAALADAGYEQKSFDPKRVGVVVGTIFGSEFSEQLKMGFNLPDFCASLAEELRGHGVPESAIESISEAYGDVLLKHMPALLDETGGFTPSTLASRITKTYDLMGGAVTIDSGQASSMAAVALAVDQLRNGDCDMVICAAGHRSMGLPIFEMFSLSSNLRTDDPKSPFDAEASGYLPGEGVGVLILKRLADAEGDGDTIRGVIDEIGVGFAESATTSVGQAVDRAYETNDAALDEISLLETSGTGSTAADVEELKAIEQRLGPDVTARPLSTVVGQIGHTQGASGMASVLKAMYALEQGRTPCTSGVSTPSAEIQNAAPHLRVAVEETALESRGTRGSLTAGVNNVDPAGAAYHLVLRRPLQKAKSSPEPARGWRIIRIGADSEDELVAQIAASLGNANDLFASAEGYTFNPRHRFRLALVAESVDDMTGKLSRAAEQIGTPKAALLDRQQIFVRQVADSPGRIAFVFAGQGSQYPGMLEPLVSAFPAAADAMSQIDEILRQLGFPPFAEVAWGDGEFLGKDVWLTQLAIMCADLIAYRSLQSMGIQPDVVAGHSFGEFPALAAAGVWDARNAVLGTRARCDAIEACRNVRGQMLSVAASGSQVEQICRESGGRVYPANYNSPDQTVVGGDAEGIDQLVERLKLEKIASKALAVPRPFHTPLMEAVKTPLKEGLAGVTFHAPRIPLLSSVNNRLVDSTEQARSNLIAQMTSPVRYVQLVEQLADFGVRGIVEVGPRDVLSRLNAKILRDRNIGVIACDQKNLDPVAGVLGVHALLDSLGLLDYPSSTPSVDVFSAPGDLPGEPPAPEAAIASPNQLLVDSSTVPNGRDLVDSQPMELATDPFDAGRERGAAASDAIRRIARRFADMSGDSFGDPELAALISRGEGLADQLDEADREELRGMAVGADVPVSALLVFNAWLDRSSQCSAAQVAFHAPHSGSTIHCFDETLSGIAPWAEIANHWKLYCQRHHSGSLYAFVTRPGAIGALAGINHHGLAISSVATTPGPGATEIGSPWRAVLVRQILRNAQSLDVAIEMLRRLQGRAGWQFCLSHALDRRLCRLVFDVDGTQVHTDVSTVVSVSEMPSLVGTGSPPRVSGVPSAPYAEPQGAPSGQGYQRFVELQAAWSPETGPSASQFAQLKTLAHTSLRLVMEPALGELVVRHDDSLMHRYQIEHEMIKTSAPVAADEGPGVAAVPVEEYLAGSQSVDGQPPFDTRGQVCHRFVLRALRTPIVPAAEDKQLVGAAVVIGQNKVAQELRRKLTDLGTTVVSLPLLDDTDKMASAMEKIWGKYRPLNFFITTPFDEEAEGDVRAEAFDGRVRRGLLLPYLACQKWFSLVSDNNLVAQAKVGAVTRMGGDLGLSGRMETPESGAFCAFMKALGIEVGYTTKWAFVAKAVDAAPGESPDFIAEAVIRELLAVSWFAEFGYAKENRYVVGALHKFPEPVAGSEPTPGRPWLITGGARGITAAVARELARRFGVKLHLVGTSPLPEIDAEWRGMTPAERQTLRAKLTKQALTEKRVPNELWHRVEKALEIDTTLQEIQALGVEVTYHSCDCSDRKGMQQLLDDIRRTDGPLEGIIHGAGYENATRFARKSVETFEKTLASKVEGAAVLMDLTYNDPLRYFFGFGSISGRWGSIGQTDYCMASDMLCKMINRYRVQRPDVRSCCFHWQPWADVGMAARGETRGANVLQEVKLLPLAEGVEHFMNELLAGAPENEVLITDWEYYKRYHPDLSPEEVAQVYSPTEPSASPAPPPAAQPTEKVRPPATDSNSGAMDVPPSKQVAVRHVMRMVEAPRDQAMPSGFQFHGPAWVLGDNQDATALIKMLQQMGVETWPIPSGDSEDALMLLLEQQAKQQIAPHLFVMTGRDPQASHIFSRDEWLSRRQNGVMLPFLVSRKWCELVAKATFSSPLSLVIATSLGGDFGFAQPVVAPEGGAMTGLVKGLFMEHGVDAPDKTILKVIDAAADMPSQQLANEILEELCVKDLGVEVAVSAQRRRVPRLKQLPVEALPRNDIPPGGTWLVTGGARGITAIAARELARRFKLKLHLFGTSQAPQVDAAWLDYDDEQTRQLRMRLVRQAREEGKSPGTYWDRARKDLEIANNLRNLADAGVQATYHCCDVTDWNQLEETLRAIRQTSGPIEGIVHGAGIHGPALSIAQTTPEILADLLAVKVDAAVALMSLTRQDPIRFFVGFGSITGRFGSFNASAYSMASDMLCKLIGWYRGQCPDRTGVGVHWHPWGEVGMMTRPVAQHTIKVFKMNLMSPLEGARHLMEELRAGAPESEVLVTDSQFYEAFYSKELLIDERCMAGRTSAPGALVEEVVELTQGAQCVTKANFDPVRDPFLREHRLRDKPTLPLVVALEAFAEAALLVGGKRHVAAIRDVKISDAVRFFNDSSKDVRVLAEVTSEGVRCQMSSDFYNLRGQLVQANRPHFCGFVDLVDSPITFEAALPEVQGQWFDMTYPDRGSLLYHGPPLRMLRRMAVDETGTFGQIRFPKLDELPGERDVSQWITPSAAIDACFYACGVYTWFRANQAFTVPHSLRSVRFGRQPRPDEEAIVQVVCTEFGGGVGVFDFVLFGDDGTVIFEAMGYRCHVIQGGGG